MSAATGWRVAPYFIVGDVVATANYYRDRLGFEYHRFWGDHECRDCEIDDCNGYRLCFGDCR